MSNFKYVRLDKQNVAVLLVDHQTGLTNLDLTLVRGANHDHHVGS